jgi:quercetin dioxygenase-like cupin family protein
MTAVTLQIERWNVGIDGKLTEYALRAKIEAKGYAVTRYAYPPGTCFPEYSHVVDKIDGVLSGRFLLKMKGRSIILEAGDALAVPWGIVHSAEVVGDEAVISLDAVRLD